MTSLGILTLFHTLISLVEIVLGIALVMALWGRKPTGPLTRWFLIATAVTLASGFVFPFNGVTPAIAVGILNVAILIVTWFAWQRQGTARVWNAVYVLGSLALLFFDCLVLIVQAFQKVPFLHALAPQGNEPAVLISQTVLVVVAALVGFFLYRGTKRVQ